MSKNRYSSNYGGKDKAAYWINNLDYNILQNIHQINFTVQDLAKLMDISVRQLYRKIEKHTGQTPLQYLKSFRLNHALMLLETGKVNSVKAAAYSTGFPNPEYFSTQFKAKFGSLPSDFL